MIGWENLQFHPLADLFPLMSEEEQSNLADSIERDGFDPAHAIVLLDGQVLDGRNRWLACTALQMEGRLKSPPPLRQFEGGSPLAFVIRENLHRRHLTESQKAALAVSLLPLLEEEARRRQGARSDIKERIPESQAGQSRDKAATAVGVNPRYVSDAKKISVEAPDLFEKLQAGTATIPEAKRELQRRTQPQFGKTPPLPEGKFSLILADPPWRYEHCLDRSDAIENQYPTMDLQAICDLPVGTLAADNCLLFLWTTSPKLEEAMRVLRAWGFTYRTSIIWVKNGLGMGHYVRVNHELLLIAARGEPGTPLYENRPASVIEAPKGRHSEKPEVFRETVERMYPAAKRIELFCRSPRPGWTAWGNEVADD